MSEVERKLASIFPQPLFIKKEPNASWTSREFIKKCLELEYRRNGSNWASVDTYVLEKPGFEDLEKSIQTELDQILVDYYEVDPENVQLYITQSWFNINGDGEEHGVHNHPNSFLSGVAYINTGEEDSINFFDMYSNTKIQLHATPVWEQPVESGDLVIFDSQMKHFVNPCERKEKRISFAFNTFVKGSIGSGPGLTELKIGI